jgi:hypothetical protein
MRFQWNWIVLAIATAIAFVCSLDLFGTPHSCDSLCREITRFGYNWFDGYQCTEIQSAHCLPCIEGRCRDTTGPGAGNCVETNTNFVHRNCNYMCSYLCETYNTTTEVECVPTGDWIEATTKIYLCVQN